MIYVEMAGRCGNQFFHYAVGRYIQIKTGDDKLCLNFEKVFKQHKESEGWYDVLAEYQTVPYEYYLKRGTILKNETNIAAKIVVGLKALQIQINKNKPRQVQADRAVQGQKFLNFFGVYWIREGVNKVWIYSRKKNIVSGICETSMIYEIADLLREELQPKKQISQENLSLFNEIHKSESVCIHVRRGDFFLTSNAKSFAICNIDYYLNAKAIMERKVKDAKYFVFSNDIEWCKENLDFGGVTYVKQNMPTYETMRLMYSCKHFILSNSTFSWWGQFLSKNENKIVISPARWNNDGYDTVLMRKDWIKIEC